MYCTIVILSNVQEDLLEFNKQDVGINVFCPDVVGLKVLAEVVISRTVDTCYSYAWFGGLTGLIWYCRTAVENLHLHKATKCSAK